LLPNLHPDSINPVFYRRPCISFWVSLRA